jgi:hypothetical protein
MLVSNFVNFCCWYYCLRRTRQEIAHQKRIKMSGAAEKILTFVTEGEALSAALSNDCGKREIAKANDWLERVEGYLRTVSGIEANRFSVEFSTRVYYSTTARTVMGRKNSFLRDMVKKYSA